jgi:hypothetical protein
MDHIYKGRIRINGKVQPLLPGPYKRQFGATLTEGSGASSVSPAPAAGGVSIPAPPSADGAGAASAEASLSAAASIENGGSASEDAEESSRAHQSSPFDAVRKAMTDSFISNFLCNVHLQQDFLKAEQDVIQQRVSSVACCCPNCSCLGPHTANQHDQVGAATVVIVTFRSAHVVKLQRLACPQCKRYFMPTATQLNCIPGTANGFTLQRTFDIAPVWFQLELLSFLDAIQYHTKSAAIYSFVQSLVQQWEQQLRYQEAEAFVGNSLQQAGSAAGEPSPGTAARQPPRLPVSVDTLQRNIGQALREYQFIMTRCETATERIDGWPLSARMPCAACVPGSIHVHYDMNFSLALRRRGKYGLDYQQPPNSRLFMKNADVLGFLDQLDKEQQQQQQSKKQRRSAQKEVRRSTLQAPAVGQQQGTVGPEEQPDAGARDHVPQRQEQYQQQEQPRQQEQALQQGDADGDSHGRGLQEEGEWPATAHEAYQYECTEFKADQLVAHDSVKVNAVLSGNVITNLYCLICTLPIAGIRPRHTALMVITVSRAAQPIFSVCLLVHVL